MAQTDKEKAMWAKLNAHGNSGLSEKQFADAGNDHEIRTAYKRHNTRQAEVDKMAEEIQDELPKIKKTLNEIIKYHESAVEYAENIQSELEGSKDGKDIDIDESELGYLIHDFTDLSKHTGERSNFSDEQNTEFVRMMQELIKYHKKIEKMNEHSKGLLY